MIKPILLVKNQDSQLPSGFDAARNQDLSPMINLVRASSGPSAVSSTPKQRAAL